MLRPIFLSLLLITLIKKSRLIGLEFCLTDPKHVVCSLKQVDERMATRFPTTPYFKKEVLRIHNEIRNSLASGQDEELNAHFMFELKWDEELNVLADYMAFDCSEKMNENVSLPSFEHPAYNYHLAYTENIDPIDFIRSSIYNWFNGTKNFNLTEITEYSGDPIISNFANIAFKYQSFLGCSLSVCNNDLLYFNCHYSGEPQIGSEIYTPFTKEEMTYYSVHYRCDGHVSTEYEYLCENPGPIFSSDYYAHPKDEDAGKNKNV